MRVALKIAVHRRARDGLVEIHLIAVEIRAAYTRKLGYTLSVADKCKTTAAAHTRSVNHNRVHRNVAGDARRLRRLHDELHHNKRTDGDYHIKLFAVRTAVHGERVAHFCAECNRLRLTSDGKIKPCLHSPDEYTLKGLDLEGMKKVMKEAIWNKPAWHGDLDAIHRSQAGRNMNEIGG